MSVGCKLMHQLIIFCILSCIIAMAAPLQVVSTEPSARPLVVYFSRTGYSKIVAEKLATRLGCEKCEIVEKHPTTGFLGNLKASFQAFTGKAPKISLNPSTLDLSSYSNVLIVGPVWAQHIASPVKTFLAQYLPKLSNYSIIYTFGGLNIGTTVRIQKEADKCVGKVPQTVIDIPAYELVPTNNSWEAHLDVFDALRQPESSVTHEQVCSAPEKTET